MALELAVQGCSQLGWTNIVWFAKTRLQKLFQAILVEGRCTQRDTSCVHFQRTRDVFCWVFSFLSTTPPSSSAWDNSLGKMTLFSFYSSQIFFLNVSVKYFVCAFMFVSVEQCSVALCVVNQHRC